MYRYVIYVIYIYIYIKYINEYIIFYPTGNIYNKHTHIWLWIDVQIAASLSYICSMLASSNTADDSCKYDISEKSDTAIHGRVRGSQLIWLKQACICSSVKDVWLWPMP